MKKILVVITIMLMASMGYCADQWDKVSPDGDDTANQIDELIQVNNEALDRLLIDYRSNVELRYASTSSLTVTAGEIAIPNSAESDVEWRRTTADTTITFSDLDTGSESASTKYYVYVESDTDETGFGVVISESSSAPTGYTQYRLVGSFYNNSDSDIDSTKVNSSYLNYDTDELESDYDSDWFTANNSTLYTKTHGITIDLPTDLIDIELYWRDSDSGSYIAPLHLSALDNANSNAGTAISYDDNYIYLKNRGSLWILYLDSSGTFTSASDGELRILANKRVINF